MICFIICAIVMFRISTDLGNIREVVNFRIMTFVLEDRIAKVTDENPFYLFIFDADDFKKINDVYGHPAGDTALRLIGQTLRCTSITCERFSARYGGDEFVVILEAGGESYSPGQFTDEINKELKRLCEASELDFTVVMSAGYAKCTSKLTSPELLIEEADRMLYKVKRRKQVS